jgi:hypothetical protein
MSQIYEVEDPQDPYEPFKGWIDIEVRDREGRVVQKGRHKMHSFNNNFLIALLAMLSSKAPSSPSGSMATTGSVTGDSGSATTMYGERYAFGYSFDASPLALNAPAGTDSFGILVGSGTTAFNLTQYSLASKISNGTSAGQLSYGQSSVTNLGVNTTVSPPVYQIQIVRPFSNVTSSAITINEVGLEARNYYNFSTSSNSDVTFLIARDVLSTSYSVPPNGSATVAITIGVTVG